MSDDQKKRSIPERLGIDFKKTKAELKVLGISFGVLVILGMCVEIFKGDDEPPKVPVAITRSEYSDWPFKQSQYLLKCEIFKGRPMVYMVDGDGLHLAINGTARGIGIREIPKMADATGQLKEGRTLADMHTFSMKGLEICPQSR